MDCVLLTRRKKVSREALENTIMTVSSKATYSGAGMSIGGWFVSSEFAVLAGLIIGVAGFFLNWYYRHKRDKREQLEHFARMKTLK